MRKGEIRDIVETHPFMYLVLEMISNGEKIDSNGPFYETHLLARQRGFTERVGEDRTIIQVSARGKEFLRRRKE